MLIRQNKAFGFKTYDNPKLKESKPQKQPAQIPVYNVSHALIAQHYA
jgi:hypothetical protein